MPIYIYILSDCNTIIPIYSTINFTNNTCIEIIDFQESNSRKLIYFIFKEIFYHQLRKNMISQLKCTHVLIHLRFLFAYMSIIELI